MKVLNIESLTEQSFEPFGRVLGQPEIEPNAAREDLDAWLGFADLFDMETRLPVWAYLRIKQHNLPLNQLERHCLAAEVFLPLEGQSVITVAPLNPSITADAERDQEELRAFLLDGSQGVFLPKGTWRWAPYALTKTATFLLLHDRAILEDIDIRQIEPYTLQM